MNTHIHTFSLVDDRILHFVNDGASGPHTASGGDEEIRHPAPESTPYSTEGGVD